MKVLVTGSNGQLGSEITKYSHSNDFEWIFSDKNSFDLSKLNEICFILDRINPDYIINCAAYTNVIGAEDDYDSANIINHKAVKQIAEWCQINNCKLIHISTDYIFDGKTNIPYSELDPANPINNYGKTKLLGENVCQKINPNSIIIRTSWLYSIYDNNFLTNIIQQMDNRTKINVVNDQYGSPTYAYDLADIIISKIIPCWIPGIYNFCNSGIVSWFDFAIKITHLLDNKIKINAISTNDCNNKVKRPKFSALNNAKIIKTFNIKQTSFEDGLKRCIKNLKI